MKKIIFACLCAATLASCNVKNSDEYKKMKAERDSLMLQNVQGTAEMDEMLGIIGEVEENFNQIKEAEKYLTVEAKNRSEMSRDTKTRVKDNFEMVNEILKKNKEQINKLNQRLKSSSGNTEGLKKSIALLTKELEERAVAIESLKTDLSKRDKEIADLKINVQDLSSDVDNLSAFAQQQADQLRAQEAELYAGYYMFGTSKELKDANVASGGFLSSLKVDKNKLDANKFIQIDIRTKTELPVYSKKAKLISDHPKESYGIRKDTEGMITIIVHDYQKFWSLTKFLVIEV